MLNSPKLSNTNESETTDELQDREKIYANIFNDPELQAKVLKEDPLLYQMCVLRKQADIAYGPLKKGETYADKCEQAWGFPMRKNYNTRESRNQDDRDEIKSEKKKNSNNM